MNIQNTQKSLFQQQRYDLKNEIDDAELNQQNSLMQSFLSEFPITLKENVAVNALVVKIDNSSKNTKVILDIGGKLEGALSKSDLNNQIKSDLIDDYSSDYKVGDVVKVHVENADPKKGYAVLSREKVIKEEIWQKLTEIFEKGEIVEGFIFNKVKCGFIVSIHGTVAFLPNSQVDTKIIKDLTPLMGKKQPFMILKMNHDQGNIVVSRRAVLESKMSKQRNEILDNIKEGDIVEGFVKNITNYGVFIDLGGIDGLLHIIDLSWKRCNHPFGVVSLGQKLKTKVIKFDKEKKRISLGLKQLMDSPWLGIEEKYPVGSTQKAVITSIADYGIFTEIKDSNGIEGLVYQTEIHWSRNINNNPGNHFHKEQEIEVKVLDIDVEKLRMNLSMKQCMKNPWDQFAEKYEAGQIIEVTVKHIVEFGIFVDLPKMSEDIDIEGLIYHSDISWGDDKNNKPDQYKVGEKINVKILVINPEKERVTLGIKQILKDPMEKMIQSLKEGQEIEGVVRNIYNNDIVVELEEGVDITLDKNNFYSEPVKYSALNSLNLYSKVKLKITEVVPKYRLIKTEFIKKI